jgi:hypothetical protein
MREPRPRFLESNRPSRLSAPTTARLPRDGTQAVRVEHLAEIVVQLLAEAADDARYCERIARLKRNDAAAAVLRSVLTHIEDAATAIGCIRDSLTTTAHHDR